MMDLTPEQFARLNQWFEEAIQLPLLERGVLIERVRRDEGDAIAEELAGLLKANDESTETMDHALAGPPRLDAPEEKRAFQDGELILCRFRIVRLLGRGGMGEVYEAFDSELTESVALKTVRPESDSGPRSAELFRREVRRARSITSHHVCRVHDLFIHREDTKLPIMFISMKLLRGETLAARIKRDGKLSPEEALRLLVEIAEGVDAAHHQRIAHGDLKSANVMLTSGEDGVISACITDFGLAHRFSRTSEDNSSVSGDFRGGTPAWMAPEQVEGRLPGPETDIYALGLIAYEMLSGRLPFDGETPASIARQRLEQPPRPIRDFVPEVSPNWELTLCRCLSRDPGRRFPSGGSFVTALAANSNPSADMLRRRLLWILPAVTLVGAGAMEWKTLRRYVAAKFPGTPGDISRVHASFCASFRPEHDEGPHAP
jgi:serine/threonine protein kinase